MSIIRPDQFNPPHKGNSQRASQGLGRFYMSAPGLNQGEVSGIGIEFSLNQAQGIFASLNTESAPVDAIWASSLAPDQADANLTQDGSSGNPYSLRRAIYSATPGKQILLKDDGIYSQDKIIQTRDSFSEQNYVGWTAEDPQIVPWNMTEPTAESGRIVIRGEPGTCPAFDCTNVGTAIDVAMDFIEISFIRFNNAEKAVAVSTAANYGGTAQGAYIHHVAGEFYRQTGGAQNIGFIYFGNSPGVKPRAEYNFVKGNNSSTNRNNACLMNFGNNNMSIKGNYFYGVIPQVVYFKHSNDYTVVGGVANVDYVFENNYCDGDISWAGSGTTVKNNIITGDFVVIADGGGPTVSQESNVIDHNTVLGSLVLHALDNNSDNNTVTNNIAGNIRYQSGGSGSTIIDPSTNTNTSDYNLINTTDDGQKLLWGSEFASSPQFKTLPEWRTYLSIDINSAISPNQLKGSGIYDSFVDFTLADGSTGIALSDTSGAVGANVSIVGVR